MSPAQFFSFGWIIVSFVLAAIPAFVVGRRLGVVHSGEAFIPFVGPSIVVLHSIRRSGWLCILGLIPFVSLIFFIWLACVIPGEHRRTRWWILPFLIPLGRRRRDAFVSLRAWRLQRRTTGSRAGSLATSSTGSLPG